MWAVFGLTDYTAFRVLAVMVHVGTCMLLFAYLRRRAQLWFAVSATIVVLFLGYAFQDLVWPFQISFTGAMAGGHRRPPVRSIGAIAPVTSARPIALAISVACSGVGLPFVGAVTLELLLRRSHVAPVVGAAGPVRALGCVVPAVRRSRRSRAPTSTSSPRTRRRWGRPPSARSWGCRWTVAACRSRVLGVVVVVVLAVDRRISPRFAAVLALPLGYWILTSLSRAAVRRSGREPLPLSGRDLRGPRALRTGPSAAGARWPHRCGGRRRRAGGAGRGVAAGQRRPAPAGCRRAARRLDSREGGAPRGRAGARSGGPRVPPRSGACTADRRGRLPRRGRRSRIAGGFARRAARAGARGPRRGRRGAGARAAGATPCRPQFAGRRCRRRPT